LIRAVNLWRAAGIQNVHFSVSNAFRFGDRFGAEFRAEFFNLFNHPIFANPSGSFSGFQDPSSQPFLFSGATPDVASSNPALGSGGPRSMQLGLKLSFQVSAQDTIDKRRPDFWAPLVNNSD
jgi:hypothetical protein